MRSFHRRGPVRSVHLPVVAVLLVLAAPGRAQERHLPPAQERHLPPDTTVTTTHEVTIRGQRVPYRATAGTMPVWDDDGKPIAALFYTHYARTDVADRSQRPLLISFNGGPGSASVWMHIGYTGPKQLLIDPEGFPIQPYGTRDNPHSVLDVADIVYVDPVNTGFSRVLGEADPKQFFGVNEDVAYLADWIDAWVSRHGYWTSPKFLIGESYGTTRVAGLAGALQNRHWMYLNGVVLVSPTDLGLEPPATHARSEVLKLPYYTAAAWYHGKLPPDLQAMDLEDVLPLAERFTVEEYLPALAYGGFLDADRKQRLAEEVARFSGLSVDFVLDYNVAVPASAFWKELLRDEGFTIGRLDSRYRGIDRTDGGERYDYPPELTSWNHAFTPAINHYLREELGFKTDLQYNIFGPVSPWNREGDDTGENLRQAMAQNPFLRVLFQVGYYDGATDYFSAKYTMWNLDPSGKLRDRLAFRAYRSGHMMYLREEDLAASNDHLRRFILDATAAARQPAKY
ncbi:MAG: carboxypeptidase [Rhodothermaceae bacterium]|nr:MAG: carboxypeptidase [Rhodothermaceae bacterium]